MYNSSLIDEYGKPLVPLDDDKLNGVKPLRIQDQIATDENGRRRFHGAFTGGFSAGYWNTVGSQEGWKPQNFKSSRNIKAAPLGQKPLDFMDEEDLEEFGNAPLSLQDREEDPTIITVDEINLKRVLKLDESKIIAATAPEREAKKTEKEKRKAAEYNKRKLYVLQKYGCDTGNASNVWHSVADEDISAAFEPAIIEPETEPLSLNDIVPTEDVSLKFGFGDYTPLSSEEPPSMAKNEPTAKVVSETGAKKQKTLSIRGHAFGVGALEEDDDDIYEREDMSRYDFSLEDRRKKKQRIVKMLVQDEATDTKVEQNIEQSETSISDEICKAPEKIDTVEKTIYQAYKDEVGKPNFLKPRPWGERKSRFAPAPIEEQNFLKPQNSAAVTAEIPHVSETPKSNSHEKQSHTQEKYQSYEQDKKQQLLALISSKSSSFVRAGDIINTCEDNLAKEKEAELQQTKDSNKKIDFPAAISSFKPFAYDEAKQQRYEQFVKANACSEKEIGEFLCTIQPKHMSEWDREMEKKEFIQSRKLYRPLDGIMGNRFVTETMPGTVAKIEPIATAVAKEEATKTVEKIVSIVRTTMSWKPSAQLCKRFNIAEPITETGIDKKGRQMKKPQLSIFDYLEGSVHTKSNFVTPVIIPKHIPCPKEIIKSALEARNQNVETTPTAPAKTSSRPSRWNVQNSEEVPRNANREVKEEKISADPRRLTYVPKADRRADKEPQATSEKRELFQAIFSDNEEDEDEEKLKLSSEIATDALKSEQKILPINSASTNLLRNMSPPRGIFAALFSATDNQNKRKNSTDNEPTNKKPRQTEDECAEKLPENSYGPAIPKNLAPKPKTENVASPPKDMLSQKPMEQRISYRGLEIIEKWVEKNVMNSSDSDGSNSSSDREQTKHKSSKKSKKAKKSKKKSKKKDKTKHKSAKHKKH